MSDDIPEEVLELSYKEMQSRFEYHLQEWEAQRNAALRSFTASLLLFSVMLAAISALPDRVLLQFSSQPITDIWDLVGPGMVGLGILSFTASLFLSLSAFRDLPQSVVEEFTPTVPNSLDSEYGEAYVRTSDSTFHPRKSKYQWYKASVAEYTQMVRRLEFKKGPFDPAKSIRYSHRLLIVGLMLCSLGIGLAI